MPAAHVGGFRQQPAPQMDCEGFGLVCGNVRGKNREWMFFLLREALWEGKPQPAMACFCVLGLFLKEDSKPFLPK